MKESLDPRAAGAQRFKGKVAIVTGAGQGIGRAAARRLGAEGASVIVADRAEETGRKAVSELQEHGVPAIYIPVDLSDYAGAQKLMAEAYAAYGRIDVLVNNVGGTIWVQPFVEYDEVQIMREVERTFWPTMWSCKAVLPYMIEQGSGSIVNLGSNSPRGIYRVPYAACKGAIFAITTSLALEVAKQGIRVNCVAPGVTDIPDRITPRNNFDNAMSDTEKRHRGDLEQFFETQVPMGRHGTVEEQAATIAFVASDDASFITGQIISVAGGSTVP